MASTSSEGVYKSRMYASCCCAIKQIESEDINPILDRPVEFSQTGCRKQEGFASDFSSCWFPVVKALLVFVILCLRTWVSLSMPERNLVECLVSADGAPWEHQFMPVHNAVAARAVNMCVQWGNDMKWWQTMVFWSPKSQRKKQRLPSRKPFAEATWDARYVGVLPHHATPTTLIWAVAAVAGSIWIIPDSQGAAWCQLRRATRSQPNLQLRWQALS